LSGDDIERILEETFLDSESSLFDSVQLKILTLTKQVIWIVREIQQVLCRAVLVIRLMWEDMSNYVGRRERFIGNSGTLTEGVDAFKMFFTEEVLE
jgi:NADH:ubiquinone oxidoreductase subunit H